MVNVEELPDESMTTWKRRAKKTPSEKLFFEEVHRYQQLHGEDDTKELIQVLLYIVRWLGFAEEGHLFIPFKNQKPNLKKIRTHEYIN